MAHINETIELNRNEGIDIDVSRIAYRDGTGDVVDIRPAWAKLQITAREIAERFPEMQSGGVTVATTEDDVEAFVKEILSKRMKSEVVSFRWVWDKFRDYKVA